MRIVLSPQRRDDTLIVAVFGEVISVNGEDFDLSAITEGYELPYDAFNSSFVLGASRDNGTLTVTLALPHGPLPPEEVAFPAPIEVVTDGEVTLPGDGSV